MALSIDGGGLLPHMQLSRKTGSSDGYGEKLFVDYAGQTIPITDSASGKIIEVRLFVATLGASSYTFAWAAFSEDMSSWI
jgi:transposase